ncbi:MAG: glycosyltransferase [Oscillospiraceae bacterium]|nr:glycosyltransferase [Oscillospiraceae bacterium]
MLSLVIPVYNEENIIENTIISVVEFMNHNFGENCEAIFVNDGSRDNSVQIAEKIIKLNDIKNNIKIISYEKNRGKGYAVRTGIKSASGDIIFFTDCDLAYGLEIIREGYEIFNREENRQAGILIGSRRKHKEGYASYTLLRKVMSVTFFAVLRTVGGIRQTTDSQSGIKGFRREAAKKIFDLCEDDGWSFDYEVLLLAQKLGLKIIEMPARIINHGKSRINPVRDGLKMFRAVSVIKKSVNNKFK